MDSHVAQLVEMGFDVRAAVAALHDHGAQFENALSFLMANPEYMPGPLHPTSSTPGQAVMQYDVSVPRVVGGSHLEIALRARGQEWVVQKQMTQCVTQFCFYWPAAGR